MSTRATAPAPVHSEVAYAGTITVCTTASPRSRLTTGPAPGRTTHCPDSHQACRSRARTTGHPAAWAYFFARASSRAYAGHQSPAFGPPRHSPSDSPGRLIHR